MPWYSRSILKEERAREVVVEYTPTQFNLGTPIQALEYLDAVKRGSDFVMNPVIREQTGVEDIQKEDLDSKAEEIAIHKMKDIQETAYKEGYDLGLGEGTKRAYEEKTKEIKSKLEELDRLLMNIGKLKVDLETQNESHLIQLVFHMASRVSLRQIEMDNNIVLDVMKQAMSLAQDEENITVQVSDKQLEFIEDIKKNSHSREFEFLKKIKIEGNPGIQPGGCIVETNYGEVDSRIEQRLSKLWEHLSEAIPRVKTPVVFE
ncbi:MAG: flagellar assembly protein [Bdellovibrionaceae bacterium]|nr:flagellar assembly protein [Pseudobdellovibrionaceae bacterium]